MIWGSTAHEQLRELVQAWAKNEPRIDLVYLFGSRAKGLHRNESDVDVAVILNDKGNESTTTYAIFNRKRMLSTLQSLVSDRVDLQFAFEDDNVVMPAVLDHGVLLYRASGAADTYHSSLSATLGEWAGEADEEAWQKL